MNICTKCLTALVLASAAISCTHQSLADAAPQKQIFEGFLHSSRPDFLTLYGIPRLDFISRTNVTQLPGWTGGVSGWDDETTLPSVAWMDQVALRYTHPLKILLLDIESYPVTTQGERLAAATKYVTIYQEMKARMPTYQIGFYQYPHYGGTVTEFDGTTPAGSPGGANYILWQGKNEDFAAMWAVVDYVFPAMYYPYDSVTDPTAAFDKVDLYFTAIITETKRCRTLFGHADPGAVNYQPIIPYVWYARAPSGRDLDQRTWDIMLEMTYTLTDGMILWGGFEPTQQVWDNNKWWWKQFLAKWPWGDRTVIKPREPMTVPRDVRVF